MAQRGSYGVTWPTAGLAAAAVDHVRLSYQYLDTGDTDGYASLVHPDAILRSPDGAERRQGAHTIRCVFASGQHVAAIGHFVDGPTDPPLNVEFADIFTVTEHGLIVAKASYYFTNPRRRPQP